MNEISEHELQENRGLTTLDLQSMPDKRQSPAPNASPPSQTLDRAGFAALYQQVYPKLWVTAAAIVTDRVQADDIVQEAAVIGLRKVEHFAVGSNFGAWMSEIVRHCALNYIRKKSNRRTITSDPNTIDETVGVVALRSTDVTTTGRLVENQSAFDDQVLSGLALLSEDARCCLLLRIVQQLSYQEISEVLCIPEGTAMSHVHRGKAALRKHLSKTSDDSK